MTNEQNASRQICSAYASIQTDIINKTNSMQDQQNQLIAKLKESQNVLVTVSKNPSVDQLAAAIGFTLALNKLDKHATAVFSGQVPETIEFLKPEETLEKSTDSLRDFIIALDKSKADKLRYKVEDQVVRIFITPYRTSISEKDLDFSQGDFNVDVVVALGVPEQQDLDDAIQAHGRILHDATVASLSLGGTQELGTLNISDAKASSLSEMVAELVEGMGQELIDSQIATALLTGIVATTNRFSNDRTTPKTMSISSVLMAAGANQQLIATELETPQMQTTVAREGSVSSEEPQPEKEPGMLEIEHEDAAVPVPDVPPSAVPVPDGPKDVTSEEPEPNDLPTPQIHVDEDGRISTGQADELPQIGHVHASGGSGLLEGPEEQSGRERMTEPPARDSVLSANIEEEGLDASTDELTLPSANMPILSHNNEATPSPEPVALTPEPQPLMPPTPLVLSEPTIPTQDTIDTAHETLSEIEQAVDSPHVNAQTPTSTLDDARNAVEQAYNASASTAPPDPIVALNAQPLGPELHTDPLLLQPTYQPAPGFGTDQPQLLDGGIPGSSPTDQTLDMPLPGVPSAIPPASSFPGVAPTGPMDNTLPPPPPVPPPPIFPS